MIEKMSDVELDLAIAESGCRYAALTLEKQRRQGQLAAAPSSTSPLMLTGLIQRYPKPIAIAFGLAVVMLGAQIMKVLQ